MSIPTQHTEEAYTQVIKISMECLIQKLSDTIHCNNIKGTIMFCKGVAYGFQMVMKSPDNVIYVTKAMQSILNDIEKVIADTTAQELDATNETQEGNKE